MTAAATRTARIIDPKSGRTYKRIMNLVEGNNDRLYLRGYIGIRLWAGRRRGGAPPSLELQLAPTAGPPRWRSRPAV